MADMTTTRRRKPAVPVVASEVVSDETETTEAVEAPAPQYTLTDQSNHLLMAGPSVMTCGTMMTDQGRVLILTVRTASTTLTVGLSQKEASAWLTELALSIREMNNEPEAEAKAS